MNLMKKILTHKGFTLVEMAIVLVVIGLLVGMGAGMIGPLTIRAKVNETKENVSAISSSMASYAATNNRLPTLSELPSSIKTQNDAWLKQIQYIAVNALTLAPPNICNYRTTPLSLNICNDAACTTPTATINNIAFILISGGSNSNNQTAANQIITTSTTINYYPVGLLVDNYAGDFTRNTDEYDDIVTWVTLDELRSKIGCQGAQLKIVNNELPYGSLSSPYPDVYIVADGGLGSANYQWCIENATGTAPAGLTYRQNITGGTALTTIFSSNCSTWTSWGTATQLVVNGTPSAGGSHFFKIFVRDGATTAANNTNKSFVLTINPQP
jgi:prepilin-type N-terminal cleavage/methylation domain-containing protein